MTSLWLDQGVFCELNNVNKVLNSLFHVAHFHAIQSAMCDLTKDSSPLQCKGHPLSTYQSTPLLPGACSTGEQPAAVMDVTRACGPRSTPVSHAPNFRDLPFASPFLLRHGLAWGHFCLGQGLFGGGSADTQASGHIILLSEEAPLPLGVSGGLQGRGTHVLSLYRASTSLVNSCSPAAASASLPGNPLSVDTDVAPMPPGERFCDHYSSRASAKAAKRCAPSEQAKGTVLTGSTLEENEKRCFSDLSPLPLSALLEAVQAPRSLQRKLWKKSYGLGVLRRSSESFPAALRPPPYTPEGWVGLPGVPG